MIEPVMIELETWAAEAVRLALDRGATDAECTVVEGDEFSAGVRLGEVEKLTDAGSRGAGIRVMSGRNSGSSYTSELTEAGMRQMVEAALGLAAITNADPYAGLPEPQELGRMEGDLELYSDDVAALTTAFKIDQARAAEQAALAADPRIRNSEGASFDSYLGRRVFANSRGFAGSYRTSSCSIAAIPVARDGEAMERDWWHTVARRAANLESPEEVGRQAAKRAVRRLNARKIPTQKAPVVFDPRTARMLVADLFDAVSGTAIYRKASFLVDKLGERVASEKFTLIDDATIPGLFGTCPFDDEGVASRRTPVIENGVLRSYLLNCYTARKLGLRTTGNASRGVSGSAVVGHGNLFVEKGGRSAGEIVGTISKGLYVTELIGAGANTVTGDYSCGIAGLWIENGELTYPVSEVTIAGNLRDMLMSVEAVGDDLDFRAAIASPTLLIGEMTISGA